LTASRSAAKTRAGAPARKHVLFIVENHAVPPDRRVWRQATAVRGWGYDVSVICRKEGTATASFERVEGVDIYRHPMPADNTGKAGYILEYASALLFELLLAVRLYLRNPFHVIHAANPPDTIFVVAAVFRLFGVKFIFDVHDLSPELYSALYARTDGLIYKTLVLAEKLSCRMADAVIATNRSYSEIVGARHGIDPGRVFVVRNDPSAGEFLTHDVSPLRNGKKVVLFLGSINPQDGVEILMEAVGRLVNELGEKDVACVVIGDGQAFEGVKAAVRRLRLEEYVDLKGMIYDREEIRKYLSLADVCVEPAPDTDINRHSTFIKIPEFMAAGKPVVAFDLKESRFSAEGAAVFVKPGDVEGFARAIRDLFHDPERRRKLGQAGRERVESSLNWKNSVDNMEKAYRSLGITP
jgi:glycosyltransferase involved in cell wall biosynthesis